MTWHEIELRILRLEESIANLLELRSLLQKMQEQGEAQIARADEVIKACNEIQMDISKMGGDKNANAG